MEKRSQKTIPLNTWETIKQVRDLEMMKISSSSFIKPIRQLSPFGLSSLFTQGAINSMMWVELMQESLITWKEMNSANLISQTIEMAFRMDALWQILKDTEKMSGLSPPGDITLKTLKCIKIWFPSFKKLRIMTFHLSKFLKIDMMLEVQVEEATVAAQSFDRLNTAYFTMIYIS